MAAQRPSNNLTDKTNVIPSINRLTEATAEDFKELSDILNDHADLFDALVQPAKFYQFHSSLAVLQAAHPNAEENGWAIIVPTNGNSPYVATFTNGAWTATELQAPIQYFNTKLNRPDPGQEGIFYVVKDAKLITLWYDGQYHDFGKNGADGVSAYQIAVSFGFPGTEEEWLASLKGLSAYDLAVANGFPGTETQWLESLKADGGTSSSATRILSLQVNPELGTFNLNPITEVLENGIIQTDTRKLTHDPSDPVLPRRDLLAYNLTTDQLELIKGDYPATSSDPVVDPTPDPLVYLYGTYINIPAASTEPSGYTGEVIYDGEGAGWTINAGASWDTQSTNGDPFGTYCIETVLALGVGTALQFTPSEPKAYTEGDTIPYKWKNIAGGTHRWLITGPSTKNGKVTQAYADPVGYSSGSVDWQSLSIAIPPGFTHINSIYLVALEADTLYYLDNITFLTGAGAVVGGYATKEDLAALEARVKALEDNSGESFTDIDEDEYGTHPAFTDQHSFNVWVLQNIGGAPEPSTPTLEVSEISTSGFNYIIT